VDLCEDSKHDAVDEAFLAHNVPSSGDGDLDTIGDEASEGKKSGELPFSSGQWFSGSSWSIYVLDAARVARLARAGDRVDTQLAEDVTRGALGDARKFVKAAKDEHATFSRKNTDDDDDDELARAPPVESLKVLYEKVGAVIAKAEAKLEIAGALRALKAATSAFDLAKLTSALATFDAIPPSKSGPLMTDRDEEIIVKARSTAKDLERLASMDDEAAALTTATADAAKAKTFAESHDAPARLAKLDQIIVDCSSIGGAAAKRVDAARAVADKVRNLIKVHAGAAAAAKAKAAEKAEKEKAAKAEKAEKEKAAAIELQRANARKEAREREDLNTKEHTNNDKRSSKSKVPHPGVSKEMLGITADEKAAVAAEELKRNSASLFCDMKWRDRVNTLTKGSRMLKLSSTSSVQGAEWKTVRLDSPVDPKNSGESLLASDPQCKNPQSRTGAYLTWPSNSLLRRGSRKLAISSITGVHVGTNAKQWCTMVPTEWHYMTITTNERSYDFGFEQAVLLLLWVNTLQRIVFPDWTRSCDAGEMSELFKGAISDAQHRFYRSSRAGASPSDTFKPSLPELCPVLYPLAPQLCSTCAELGVSFASEAERAQKFCMWTAVAVLEAPVPHDHAVTSMRAVLSDLGFYAEGRFACSAGFYDENGLAHTLAKDAIASSTPGDSRNGATESGMLVIRAQHAKTGKVSVLKIKKGTKMASVFEAHAKHKGLRTQALSVVK